MGSKRLDSLSDYLRHGYRLRIDCKGCGRGVIVDPFPILERCHKQGWPYTMPAIERRLRCSICGGKNLRLGPAFGD